MMEWLKKNILDLTAVGFFILFCCWLLGYFSNGFCGTHFEINSVWTGIGALGGTGFFSSIKYITDSCKNSEQGKMPWEVMKHENSN